MAACSGSARTESKSVRQVNSSPCPSSIPMNEKDRMYDCSPPRKIYSTASFRASKRRILTSFSSPGASPSSSPNVIFSKSSPSSILGVRDVATSSPGFIHPTFFDRNRLRPRKAVGSFLCSVSTQGNVLDNKPVCVRGKGKSASFARKYGTSQRNIIYKLQGRQQGKRVLCKGSTSLLPQTQIRMEEVEDEEGEMRSPGCVVLGFTRDGSHLISYQETVLPEVFGGDIFERVSAHVYTLQFWSFHPRRRAIKQHTVPLFGSKGIHMTDDYFLSLVITESSGGEVFVVSGEKVLKSVAEARMCCDSRPHYMTIFHSPLNNRAFTDGASSSMSQEVVTLQYPVYYPFPAIRSDCIRYYPRQHAPSPTLLSPSSSRSARVEIITNTGEELLFFQVDFTMKEGDGSRAKTSSILENTIWDLPSQGEEEEAGRLDVIMGSSEEATRHPSVVKQSTLIYLPSPESHQTICAKAKIKYRLHMEEYLSNEAQGRHLVPDGYTITSYDGALVQMAWCRRDALLLLTLGLAKLRVHPHRKECDKEHVSFLLQCSVDEGKCTLCPWVALSPGGASGVKRKRGVGERDSEELSLRCQRLAHQLREKDGDPSCRVVQYSLSNSNVREGLSVSFLRHPFLPFTIAAYDSASDL